MTEEQDTVALPLTEPAHRFNFFALVRLLDGWMAARLPNSVPIGERGPPSKERIRLRPSLALGFPAADCAEVRQLEANGKAEVTTNFLGVYGVDSPMPRWFAQQLLWDASDYPQQRAFLDLFHHRLLSLLYRGWLFHHHEHNYEPGGTDMLSRTLLEMVGVTPEFPAAEIGIEPFRLLRYMNLLLMRTRPSAGLTTLLSEEFELTGRLRIDSFPERWVTIDDEQLHRLPRSPGENGRLGQHLFLGKRRLDRMGMVQVRVGPVESYDEFLRLAPGGKDHIRIVRLTRFFVRQPLDVRLLVEVPLPFIPQLRLSNEAPVQLGPLAYCRSSGPSNDVQESIIFRFDIVGFPETTHRASA